MKKNTVKYLALVVLAAVILLLAGLTTGIPTELLSFFAFALPVLIGHGFALTSRREREEEMGVALPPDRSFCPEKKDLLALLPIIAPTVGLILLVSVLTGNLLVWMGLTEPALPEGSFVALFFASCLAPAVLEEMLFRYLPLRLIAPHSAKWAVMLSAVTFAVFHGSLFSIPYAFVAGLIFMSVDIATGSVIPSFILHLVNNTLSVLILTSEPSRGALIAYYSVISALSILGVAVVFIKRKEYCAAFKVGAERISYGRK